MIPVLFVSPTSTTFSSTGPVSVSRREEAGGGAAGGSEGFTTAESVVRFLANASSLTTPLTVVDVDGTVSGDGATDGTDAGEPGGSLLGPPAAVSTREQQPRK